MLAKTDTRYLKTSQRPSQNVINGQPHPPSTLKMYHSISHRTDQCPFHDKKHFKKETFSRDLTLFFVVLLSGTLEPTYRQLKSMKLDRSPFVIISVIGQELLAQGKYSNAVEVLESALKIGTCSLKLRGSVFSALSSAYWALNSLDKVSRYIEKLLHESLM